MKLISIAVSILFAANVATAQQPENLPVTCQSDGITTCELGAENSCDEVCGTLVPLPCQTKCNGTPNPDGIPGGTGVLSCTIRKGNSVEYHCANPSDDEVEDEKVVVITERTAATSNFAQQPENLPEPDTCDDLGIETCEGDDNSACFGFGSGHITCAKENGTGRVLRCTVTKQGHTFECRNPPSDEAEEEQEVVVSPKRAAAKVATAQQPENFSEPVTCEDWGIETCQDENSCFDECGEEDSLVKAPCQVRCGMNGKTGDMTWCKIMRGSEIKFQCSNNSDDEVVVHTERTLDNQDHKTLTKSMLGLLRGIGKN